MGATIGPAGRRAWRSTGGAGGWERGAGLCPQDLAAGRKPCRRVVVDVDGSPGCAAAVRQAASQARQRNATLDVVCVVPTEADARAVTLARVRLAEFTRQACPYGIGAPMRLRVEQGDPWQALDEVSDGAELLITGRHRG